MPKPQTQLQTQQEQQVRHLAAALPMIAYANPQTTHLHKSFSLLCESFSRSTDGVHRLKKWKGRLAVVGTGEIPVIDSSFSNFSPTVAFSTVRMLVALTVDPRYSVEIYDLSDAFLGTELRDRAVYVRLPDESGECVGKYYCCWNRFTSKAFGSWIRAAT